MREGRRLRPTSLFEILVVWAFDWFREVSSSYHRKDLPRNEEKRSRCEKSEDWRDQRREAKRVRVGTHRRIEQRRRCNRTDVTFCCGTNRGRGEGRKETCR